MFLPLLVRTAVIDMTPAESLPLGGYTERSNKMGHPSGKGFDLAARTVVFEQGSTRVAVVAFDTLTIPDSLYREVAKRVPESEVMLVATHTHSAPDSQMLNDRMTLGIPGIADYRSKWLKWTASRLADGIHQALAAPPVQVRSLDMSHTSLPDSNRNRRHGPPPSPRVTVLSADGRPLLFSFPAHATLLGARNLTYSGDWPGLASRMADAGFVPGAIGDASPVSAYTDDEAVVDLAVKVSSATLGPLGNLVGPGSLTIVRAPIALAKPSPHPHFAADYKVPDILAKLLVDKFAPTSASLTIMRLGRLAIVGVPGEPTGDVGRRIEQEAENAGYWACLVVSHCNGWIGYVLQPEDYDQGGYEADLGFHGRETADRIIEAARSGLARASAG